MMENTHSPGEWIVADFTELDYWFVEQPATGDIIAKVYKCAEEGDGRANAELIAQAPALLEVARRGAEMRVAQNAYFAARISGEKGAEELKVSKVAEKKFDDAVKALAGKVVL